MINKHFFVILGKISSAIILLGLFVCISISLIVQLTYTHRIIPADHLSTVQTADAIMVLGASVKSDGTPSDALRDRLLTGVELYEAHKAPVILITGDDGGFRANEITVMKRFLIEQGIPTSTVHIDGEGYRTYESCKRAAERGIHTMIVVTQRFHLARALYLCNKLGIDTDGVIADKQHYSRIVFFWSRDLLSSIKAWWDIHVIAPPSPVDG